jgi:hypothetical protein
VSGGEGLVKVDPLSLLETAHNLVHVSVLQHAIRLDLVLEEPLVIDDIDAAWSWNEGPRAGNGEVVAVLA